MTLPLTLPPHLAQPASMPSSGRQTPLARARTPARAHWIPLGDVDAFVPNAERPVRVRARTVPVDGHIEPHRHAWAQLAYSAIGVTQVSVAAAEADTTYIVPPSRAVWIAPGLLHSIVVLEAAELRTLYVHPSAVPAGWDDCRVITVTPLARELVSALENNTADLQRERLLSAALLDELGRAEAHRAFGVALPLAGRSDKRLRALCEAVLRDPADRATLAERAANFGASERTMARLFHDALGMGWQQWRQQAMLAHALPLLAAGAPIGQVAVATGYASESAFSAMFKAALGQSPSVFMKKKRL